MKKLAQMIFIASLFTAGGAFANKGMDMNMNLSKQDREKLADMHTKMATCLRTDKMMKDCHEEMKKSCQAMGEDHCPMMGWHHMDKGMKGTSGQMMNDTGYTAPGANPATGTNTGTDYRTGTGAGTQKR